MNKEEFILHIPVMLEEVLAVLSPKEGESYLDLTAGYGGHAVAVLKVTGAEEKAVLVDRDQFAIDQLKLKFGLRFKGVELVKSDFGSAVAVLKAERRKFDMILVDLGVSSVQLDDGERGFSFSKSAVLDMRMDQSQDLTAVKVVNEYSEADLVKILKLYGDEPRAARIAKEIIKSRPLATTSDLEAVVKKVYGGRWKDKNPATKTFQAIRVEVNDEMEQLRMLLDGVSELLNDGGRLAIISFQSSEDRMVKEFFRGRATGYDGDFKYLQKHKPSATIETVRNRRSRSAILRSAVYENKHNKN
jgi:16S rRNA (cytosine1402-N4)-methyltransferase